MAVRTLDQVIAELNSTYQPQVDTLRQRQSAIPEQIQQEEQGLQARQEQAFGDILSGARRRGMGFSGIPLAEQARYTSTEFLPALARLKQSGRDQAMSLEDAINQIYERRNTMAHQLQQGDYQRDLAERQFQESIRQFNEQQAAARHAAAASVAVPTLGGGNAATGGGGSQPAQVVGRYGYKNEKDGSGGYWFTDNVGNAISAAKYAQLNNIPLATLLQKMAASGDAYARAAINSKPAVATTWDFSRQFPLLYGVGQQQNQAPARPANNFASNLGGIR